MIVKKVQQRFLAENARSQRAAKNVFGSLLSKGGSIAIGLFLVPVTINYVSSVQYGVWLTLSSIVGWFAYFDVGFGQGLRNKFAEAVAKDDTELAKTYVSTTYAALAIIMAALFALFALANPFLNWAKILNAPASMTANLQGIVLVVMGFFCIQLVLQLLNTVVIANQQPAFASFITFSGNIISLAVIFLLTKFTKGNLSYLAVTLSVSPVIAFAFFSLWLYSRHYKRYAPSFRYIQFKYARNLMSLGLKFFVLQIGTVILFQTNSIIINQLFGPEQVTSYVIAFKYFGSVMMLFAIIISPFWSATTEAWIKQDLPWIKGIIKKLKSIFFILAALLLVMLLICTQVYHAWVGDDVKIPFALSLAVAISTGLQIWQTIFLHFLNGISKIMLQLYLLVGSSLINIPLAVFFGRQFGVWGVVLSSIVVFSILGSVMYVQTEKIINQKAHGIWNH